MFTDRSMDLLAPIVLQATADVAADRYLRDRDEDALELIYK